MNDNPDVAFLVCVQCRDLPQSWASPNARVAQCVMCAVPVWYSPALVVEARTVDRPVVACICGPCALTADDAPEVLELPSQDGTFEALRSTFLAENARNN